MDKLLVSKRMIILQFLIWWGVYILFMALLIGLMVRSGRQKHVDLKLIAAVLECTAMGAFMAIYHYYGLYTKYFRQKKYPMYLALLVCFVGIFIMLDSALFCVQIGWHNYISDGLSRALFIDFERVMYAYAPVALIYTISRNIHYRRKQGRMAKFAEHIA